MKVLVLVFHPDLRASRVNAAWVRALQADGRVTIHRPCEEYPDWRIDVPREQQLLREHDRIVLQHPFYWYSMPPLMKKWLDDVLTYGWAYGPGGTALQGKQWLSAISTGGPGHSYQAGGYNGFSMSELLKPMQQTASLLGMGYLPAFVEHGAVRLDDAGAEASARRYAHYVLREDLDPAQRLAQLLRDMQQDGTQLASA